MDLINPETHPSIENLKTIPVFADLGQSQLEWLAAHFSDETFEPGAVLVQAGTPADYMLAIFDGEIQARRANQGKDDTIYMAKAGTVTGKLPFSRMKEFPSTVRAVGRLHLGRIHEVHFSEMFQVIPELGERLVGVLSDRVREVARVDQNREKLAALGKLSAGLAHELNNPASAASRAAGNLRDALKQLAEANRNLAACPMTDEQRRMLAEFEDDMSVHMDSKPVLDTLAQSDLEEELCEWFEEHHLANGWEIAPVLADSGFTKQCLNDIENMVGDQLLASVVRRTSATVAVERILREMENSMDRITTLVRAVKEYSYMDRVQEQEVDVHRGLDNTLTMLTHSLKHGVKVIKNYDKALPRIVANGGELNQVWTNIIDNAITAMSCEGELRIRTARENDDVLVEITDNGPGIPPEIQDRIFEPFFTTKGVGQGTGLGLDFVYRIISRHHGNLRVNSKPGETTFQVRLPLTQLRPALNENVYAHQSD